MYLVYAGTYASNERNRLPLWAMHNLRRGGSTSYMGGPFDRPPVNGSNWTVVKRVPERRERGCGKTNSKGRRK